MIENAGLLPLFRETPRGKFRINENVRSGNVRILRDFMSLF
jgi:hypothetical protein